jgi:hypothetical protein
MELHKKKLNLQLTCDKTSKIYNNITKQKITYFVIACNLWHYLICHQELIHP